MNDGKRKRPQKHQNRTAFKINFDTQALQMQKKVSLRNLCARCTEQMQWKLQYNKYKKMTQPGRCNFCHDKSVFRSYMKACQPCIQAKNVCAKCLQPDYEGPAQVKKVQKQLKKQQQKNYQSQIEFMKTLQQRSRRTVRRHLQKGTITWDPDQQYFVDQQGNKMAGLHFRKFLSLGQDNQNGNMQEDNQQDYDDDEMFGDEDDLQDDQQQQKSKGKDKNKNKQKQQPKKDNNQLKKNQKPSKQNDSDVQGDEIDFNGQQLDDQGDDEQQDLDQNDQNQQGKNDQQQTNNNQQKNQLPAAK